MKSWSGGFLSRNPRETVSVPTFGPLEARSRSTSKSAVSRRFVTATTKAMGELMARNLSDLDVAVLMIDGLDVAGSCVVVCLVITADGTKVPVGLWLGDTENKTVVTALLADLVARGLNTESGVLCVIDGAKALAAGIKKVFGETAKVQRCVLHKRRNVEGHLPKDLAEVTDRRLALIFVGPNAVKGLAAATALAKELEADHPDAAASLREGLDDMFTVRRLGVGSTLASHSDHDQLHRVDDLDRKAHHRSSDQVEGRLHEEALDRRRHARSRALIPASTRAQGHGQAGRSATPRGHACRCYTRRVRSGCSLNTLWPPLNFNKKRDIVAALGPIT